MTRGNRPQGEKSRPFGTIAVVVGCLLIALGLGGAVYQLGDSDTPAEVEALPTGAATNQAWITAPTATDEPPPSPTPTVTATASVSPSPTVQPASTETPAAASTATATPEPTATPTMEGPTPPPKPTDPLPDPVTNVPPDTLQPVPVGPEPNDSTVTHVRVPSAGIDSPVVQVGYQLIQLQGQTVIQWDVAQWAAGHHSISANPGEGGNVVIAGHVAGSGEVFRTLEYAEVGDEVLISTTEGEFRYVITEVHLRLEAGAPLEERLAIGAFMDETPDERVTLITCWPYGVYDHRLIVVAKPA